MPAASAYDFQVAETRLYKNSHLDFTCKMEAQAPGWSGQFYAPEKNGLAGRLTAGIYHDSMVRPVSL